MAQASDVSCALIKIKNTRKKWQLKTTYLVEVVVLHAAGVAKMAFYTVQK
jgi:hypothetical protein